MTEKTYEPCLNFVNDVGNARRCCSRPRHHEGPCNSRWTLTHSAEVSAPQGEAGGGGAVTTASDEVLNLAKGTFSSAVVETYDPVEDLASLVRDDVRVTYDPGSNVTHPCTFCGRAIVPPNSHKLYRIGHYPNGDVIRRPVCELDSCKAIARIWQARVEAKHGPETDEASSRITHERARDLCWQAGPENHATRTLLLTYVSQREQAEREATDVRQSLSESWRSTQERLKLTELERDAHQCELKRRSHELAEAVGALELGEPPPWPDLIESVHGLVEKVASGAIRAGRERDAAKAELDDWRTWAMALCSPPITCDADMRYELENRLKVRLAVAWARGYLEGGRERQLDGPIENPYRPGWHGSDGCTDEPSPYDDYFGTDPEDSAALLKLRQAIDTANLWPSEAAKEAGDYEAAVGFMAGAVARARAFEATRVATDNALAKAKAFRGRMGRTRWAQAEDGVDVVNEDAARVAMREFDRALESLASIGSDLPRTDSSTPQLTRDELVEALRAVAERWITPNPNQLLRALADKLDRGEAVGT